MITATLPSPTPSAGVPDEYAARTFACEPVATTRSAERISSCVASLVTGAGSICTRSAGAPTFASSEWMNSSSSAQVDQPLGEGATITALRPFRALRILLAGVAPGFVEGVSAATTPAARAISTMPSSGYSAITPTLFAPCRSRSRPIVLRSFLAILSGTLPRPVSATASSASRRLFSGLTTAQPAALTTSSTLACE